MGTFRGRRRILPWGDGYGIRLTREELDRLGVVLDELVDVEVSTVSEQVRRKPRATGRFVHDE